MPPRSTNAPKSAMFLTMPLRIWPILISSSSVFFWLRALIFDQLAAADDDVAAFLVDLEDFASMVRPMYSPMSGGRRMSTWEAGRKTGTPMSTSRPPLILRVTLPRDEVAFLVLGDDLVPIPSAASPCGSERAMVPSSSSTVSSKHLERCRRPWAGRACRSLRPSTLRA